MQHIPVFNKLLVKELEVKPQGVYVDVTLGAGGHTQQILERLDGGTLIVFDVDPKAIENLVSELQIQPTEFKENLQQTQTGNNRLIIANQNFNNLAQVLQQAEIPQVDGIIADLGWSTDQLQHIPGLSFQNPEALLDMRLDQTQKLTAANVLNGFKPDQLESLFTQLADLHYKESKQLVTGIVAVRKTKPIETVADLNQILEDIKSKRKHNIHKRVYQALRIFVNQEAESLSELINQSLQSLKPAGRLLVITFHSGEEKLVEENLTIVVNQGKASWIWDRKYQQPTVAELRRNFKAHSAKLYAIVKN